MQVTWIHRSDVFGPDGKNLSMQHLYHHNCEYTYAFVADIDIEKASKK